MDLGQSDVSDKGQSHILISEKQDLRDYMQDFIRSCPCSFDQYSLTSPMILYFKQTTSSED